LVFLGGCALTFAIAWSGRFTYPSRSSPLETNRSREFGPLRAFRVVRSSSLVVVQLRDPGGRNAEQSGGVALGQAMATQHPDRFAVSSAA
jgi:hypothetical protein